MKIAGIGFKTPSLRISNDDIIQYLQQYNPELAASQLNRCQREVSMLLEKSGANLRYFRDIENGETAIQFAEQAVIDALSDAQVQPQDLDLILYCGVGRGFVEPANAYFIASLLGVNCCCFDIVDACMSWVRALEIANMYLQQPAVKNVLVVNAEFTVYEYGFPDIFRSFTRERIHYTFPAFTIGEAATATVLSKSPATWQFHFKSVPQAASFCTIPMAQFQQFCAPGIEVAENGPNRFASWGNKLFDQTEAGMPELVKDSGIDLLAADLLFPHGAAAYPVNKIIMKLGVSENKIFNKIFSSYGNLVSASIPAALKVAVDNGELQRGMKCILCPASAGMSFGLVELVY